MEPKANRRQFSLRLKIVSLTGGSVALVASILVLTSTLQMRTMATEELRKRGNAVGIELSNNLAFATFSRDKVGLQSAADATLGEIEDVAYVLLRAESGEVLAASYIQEVSKQEVNQQAPEMVPFATQKRVDDRRVKVSGIAVHEVSAPISIQDRSSREREDNALLDPLAIDQDEKPREDVTDAGSNKKKRVGVVHVGFRLDRQEAEISSLTTRAIALGLVVLMACLGAALVLARMLTVPLERLSQAAAAIARGDLRQQFNAEGNDEISELAASFETMASGLRQMLADLRTAATDIEGQAASIQATATQQATMSSEQASAINETTATVAEIAQTAKQVIQRTQKSEELSQDGQKVVQESVSGMDKLGEQVKAIALAITDLSERTLQIGDIITTVKDVAEQSNMLALNASIEAAKAGEHGRGFAVVAMEMRNLTEQSKLAAGQVRTILGEVQKGTRTAVSATEEGSKRAHAATSLAQSAGSSIVGLTDMMRESSLAARQIAGNTRQQTTGVEQIVSAMTELSSAMADTVEGTRQIEQVAGNLTTVARRFSALVSRYQL